MYVLGSEAEGLRLHSLVVIMNKNPYVLLLMVRSWRAGQVWVTSDDSPATPDLCSVVQASDLRSLGLQTPTRSNY